MRFPVVSFSLFAGITRGEEYGCGSSLVVLENSETSLSTVFCELRRAPLLLWPATSSSCDLFVRGLASV